MCDTLTQETYARCEALLQNTISIYESKENKEYNKLSAAKKKVVKNTLEKFQQSLLTNTKKYSDVVTQPESNTATETQMEPVNVALKQEIEKIMDKVSEVLKEMNIIQNDLPIIIRKKVKLIHEHKSNQIMALADTKHADITLQLPNNYPNQGEIKRLTDLKNDLESELASLEKNLPTYRKASMNLQDYLRSNNKMSSVEKILIDGRQSSSSSNLNHINNNQNNNNVTNNGGGAISKFAGNLKRKRG